jgi:hypothetical protein
LTEDLAHAIWREHQRDAAGGQKKAEDKNAARG